MFYFSFFYSFLVGNDGNVYEGRGWYVKPEKTIIEPESISNQDLDTTINIAFIGKHSSKLNIMD